MGLNTSLAEQVRKTALGRDMRQPIVDGCVYNSFDEIQDHAITSLKDGKNEAKEELDSALRSEKYNLSSTVVSGKNDLNETLDDNSKQLKSVLVTEDILLKKDVEYQTAHFYEEFQKSVQGLPEFRQIFRSGMTEIAGIRQNANDDLDVIGAKCDTRITEVEMIPISGKEGYCTMALILGGDADG